MTRRIVLRVQRRDVRRNGKCWALHFPDEWSLGALHLGAWVIHFGVDR